MPAAESAAAAGRALSLSYYTVPELSFAESVDVAAATACRHVGVRLLNGGPEDSATALLRSAPLRKEALQRMRDAGITALDASAARLRTRTDVALFAPLLEACEELGVRYLLCNIDGNDRSVLTEKLFALAERAAAHRLHLAIEFVPWMAVASLADAADLVKLSGRDNIIVAVDALHLHRGGNPLDLLARLPARYFPYAQICDAHREFDPDPAAQMRVATEERLFPGEGELDLQGLLRALPPGIPLALEIPTATLARTMPALERVTAAVAATRALLASVDGQPFLRPASAR